MSTFQNPTRDQLDRMKAKIRLSKVHLTSESLYRGESMPKPETRLVDRQKRLAETWNRLCPAGTEVTFGTGRTRFTMGPAELLHRIAVFRLAGIVKPVQLSRVKPVDKWIQSEDDQ